jgi:RimJ/RimL family protein N-acetyltransferase
MSAMSPVGVIKEAGPDDLPAFFAYWNDHLSDNGSAGTALFMPMPRSASHLSPERQEAFRQAVALPFGQPGWRKLWLAWSGEGEIAGHVDLRARAEPAATHRALLGMGVDRRHRQQGVGRRLLEAACDWALQQPALDWIDLEVLSVNAPARRLYESAGFVECGYIEDLFRIDGQSLGDTLMRRRLLRSTGPAYTGTCSSPSA